MHNNYPKLEIKDTKIYGMGVFALEDIGKGRVIRFFGGEVVSFSESIERIRSGEEAHDDTLQVGLELDMDLDEFSRTFNHSCNPNAGHRKMCELVAIRDIKKGEEITYDYSATVGPNIPTSLWTMQCNCGQLNCRKILGNVLSIPENQLAKYKSADALQDYILEELALIERSGGQLPIYKEIKL